jgi:hypothetical protein
MYFSVLEVLSGLYGKTWQEPLHALEDGGTCKFIHDENGPSLRDRL